LFTRGKVSVMPLAGIILTNFLLNKACRYFILHIFHFHSMDMMGFDFETYMHSIADVVRAVMPIAIIAGGIYLWGGINIVRKVRGTFQLQLAAVLNILWYVFYIYLFVIKVYPVFMDVFGLIDGIQEVRGFIFVAFIISFIFGAVYYCGYPVFLLIYLKRKN